MQQVQYPWQTPLQFIDYNGFNLAYRFQPGKKFTLVYLGGFHSNMNGDKCFAVFNHAHQQYGFSTLCLDYSGHGSSSGVFAEGNVSTWLNDALFIIKKITKGPLIFCGSSMGAWISLLASIKLKKRVKGILTIAAATDMTQRFIWDRCDEKRRKLLKTEGFFDYQSQYDDEPYRITMQLVEDGKNHLLLNKENIPLSCPIRLLHATGDAEISWQNSLDTMNKLLSNDAQLKLIKNSGHRLSSPSEIEEILASFDSLIKAIN